MKRFGIISAIASFCLLFWSCSAEIPGPGFGNENVKVSGTVCDDSGAPIEHIKVTLDWNSGKQQDVKYTSSVGKFESYIQDDPQSDVIILVISLEDIDGEGYGGKFESYSETITLVKEDITEPVLRFDYRLNRATASESNPLS